MFVTYWPSAMADCLWKVVSQVCYLPLVLTRTMSPDAQASLVDTNPIRLSSSVISEGTFGAWPSGQEGWERRSSTR